MPEPVDHDELVAAVTVPATGAVCIFSGMVRGQTGQAGQIVQTSHLEYEAYESMALAKMQQVADEIREQLAAGAGHRDLVQRLGRAGSRAEHDRDRLFIGAPRPGLF
jgi:MoaE-MoaD fusion protein